MLTPHGATCKWGTTSLTVQSLSFSASAPAEIDITGMTATVDSDPTNTSRKIVRRQVDYAVRDIGEVSFDFIANTTVLALDQLIGTKRNLSFTAPGGGGLGGFTVSSPNAFLTSVSIQAQAGDFVRGSMTFKFSG